MKQYTTCPRCGYKRARPNARGPDHVFCKQCRGLVPLIDRDGNQGYSDDPVRSAIARERGDHDVGVIRTTTPTRGGL